MKWSKISIGIAFAAYLALPGCCNGETPKQHPVDTAVKAMDTLYTLDQHKTEVAQALSPAMLAGHKYRFVQVEVIKVTNPQKHPLLFNVYYQSPGKAKVLLGTFSLYPADNPGKFIVATQGKVTGEGSIILSMTSTEKMKASDELKVVVKKIGLREK